MERIEHILGTENASLVIEQAETYLGAITDIEIATGGLVHYVFRMRGDLQTAYLKVRGGHYSGIPDIKTQPELIDNERHAIELFIANTPEYFPAIILYNPDLHFLLLSDVMPGGLTVDQKYSQGEVTMEDIYHFGRALGDIHTKHASTEKSVRDPNDQQYQANLMRYALETYEHPTLLQAAQEHKRRPTQLLIGDISPKNTYIENGVVRFCDLENAHQGALPYDQAFALAHILLHQQSAAEAIAAMDAFLVGYTEKGSAIGSSDELVAATLHGILLYRLDNPVIPYPLSFSDGRRKRMASNVFESLNADARDLEEIANNLFKE